MVHVGGVFTDVHQLLVRFPDVREHPQLNDAVARGELELPVLWQATLLWFTGALIPGIYLYARLGLPALALGALGIGAAAWYAAGGRRPMAARGLADPVFFVMFGFVAVAATYYVQARTLTPAAFIVGLPMAALVNNVLVIDDIRDVDCCCRSPRCRSHGSPSARCGRHGVASSCSHGRLGRRSSRWATRRCSGWASRCRDQAGFGRTRMMAILATFGPDVPRLPRRCAGPFPAIRRVMTSRSTCAVFILLAACGGHEDWTKKPLAVAATGTTNHKSEYTLKVPDGLDKSPASALDCWEVRHGPSICISETLLPVLDLKRAAHEAVNDVMADEAKIVEQSDAGGRMTVGGSASNKIWLVSYIPASSERDIACTVKLFTRGAELEKPQPLLAWMKSVCASFALKTPYQRPPLPPQLVELLSQLDGQHAHVAAAIAKLKDPAMTANEDLGAYDLREPMISYEHDREIGRCFAITAKAGATDRDFEVCFNTAGKIAVIALEPLKRT